MKTAQGRSSLRGFLREAKGEAKGRESRRWRLCKPPNRQIVYLFPTSRAKRCASVSLTSCAL